MILFVGNLSVLAKKQDLTDLFKTYGEILSIEILKDPITYRSRGCAYVHMEEYSDAMRAVDTLNNSMYMKQQLIVSAGGPRNAVQKQMLAQKKNK